MKHTCCITVVNRIHTSGQIIATSHDLTPNGSLVREIPLFQGNLGWWNIIIWPDTCQNIQIIQVFQTYKVVHSQPLGDTLCLLFRLFGGAEEGNQTVFYSTTLQFLGKTESGFGKKNMFSCEVCCELPRILIEIYELLNDAWIGIFSQKD